MNADSFWSEIIVSLVVVFFLGLVVNPFGFWMPSAMAMMLVAALVVAFALFAIFFWRERARDEREHLHRLLAGRIAFLAGAGTLVIGIAVQTIRHTPDPWLAAALAAMILGKIAGLMYGRVRH